MCSGSAPAAMVVKPTRSAIRTVATLRSSSETPRRWPHSWQKRAPAAVVAPQAGQVIRPRYRAGAAGPSAIRAAPRTATRCVRHSGLAQVCRQIEEISGEGTRMERTQSKGRKGSAPQERGAKRSRRGSGPPAASDITAVLDALPQPAFGVEIGDDEACQFVHANARYRTLFDLDLERDL